MHILIETLRPNLSFQWGKQLKFDLNFSVYFSLDILKKCRFVVVVLQFPSMNSSEFRIFYDINFSSHILAVFYVINRRESGCPTDKVNWNRWMIKILAFQSLVTFDYAKSWSKLWFRLTFHNEVVCKINKNRSLQWNSFNQNV